MCTRFFLDEHDASLAPIMQAARKHRLWNEFMDRDAGMLVTSGEVRPTDIAAVIAPNSHGIKAVYPMKWGYKLSHTTLFNARSETANIKPTFREDWKRHRCIIPASYYFEWEHKKDSAGKVKTGDKYLIQPAGSTITCLCGLYRIENGLPYFVVLTRKPGPEITRIHDRMPLILPPSKIDEWINPNADPDAVTGYSLTHMTAEKA